MPVEWSCGVLFQRGANVIFEVVNNDEIRKVGQNVLNFQAVALFHNLDGWFNALVLPYSKQGYLQPQRLPQHII
jgi:hypothetical protein